MPPQNALASRLKTFVLLLGTVWLFAAFALYFGKECFSYGPMGSLLLGHYTFPVAWVDMVSSLGIGFSPDVARQGMLLVWTAALASLYGFLLMRKTFGATIEHLDAWVWGAGIALGIGGNLVLFAGLLGGPLFTKSFFTSYMLLLSVPLLFLLPRIGRFFMALKTERTPCMGWLERVLWIFLALLYLITLLYALTPPMQSDAVRYHMAAPQEWMKAGRITYLPYNAFSNFPSLIEMLFLYGMILGGNLLGQAMHFLYLPLMAGAAAALTREILLQCPTRAVPNRLLPPPAFIAAFLFSTLPIATPLAGWAFIDLAVAFYTLGMIHFLLRWTRTRQMSDWVLAAAMGGLLCASKYTGVVPVFVGGVALAFLSRFAIGCEKRPSLVACAGRMVAFGVIACAIASPWWIKNVVYTHNPVYPLANNIFKGGEWTAQNADFYTQKLKEKGIAPEHGLQKILDTIQLPWLTAAYPRTFEDFEIGPLFWVTCPWIFGWCLLALWRWRARPGPALFAAWIFFLAVFWYFTYQSNRFLMPFWALTAVVAAVLTARRIQGKLHILCLIGLPLPALYGSAESVRWLLLDTGRMALDTSRMTLIDEPPYYKGPRVWKSNTLWPAYTLGALSEPAYLAQHLPYAASAEAASRNLKPTDKVLLVGEHRKMYWRCRVEGSDWYDQPLILSYLQKAKTADALLDAIKSSGFTHIFFNLEEWGWPGDVRVLTGQVPIQIGSAWSYNRRYFTPEQLLVLHAALQSPRLKTVHAAKPGRIYTVQID